MKQTDIPAQVAIESRALEIAQRLDDELLGATLPQSAAYESLTRLLEGAADTLRELVVFRRAAPPSGDRSLLRAPTEPNDVPSAEWLLRMASRERDVDVRETLEAAAAALRDVEVFVKGSGELANEWKRDCARIAQRCEADVKELTVWLGASRSSPAAVDGLRGTEDRALREGLEEIASEAYHAIPYYAYGDNEAARHLANRLEKIAGLVRVLRESVEGEQRT